MSNTTIVTGIWDIKRDELTEGWSRSFQHYLDNLAKLMKTDQNMIIFIEEKNRNCYQILYFHGSALLFWVTILPIIYSKI